MTGIALPPGHVRSIAPSLVLLAGVILLGGASRMEVPAHAVIRAASLLALGWTFVRMDLADWAPLQIPLLILLCWSALIALHLLPLPPEAWRALPHREGFAQALESSGLDRVWRPLSLTPNRTRNAFFAALVPLAVLVTLARLRGTGWRAALVVVLAIGAVSAVLSVVQISTAASWAYPYRVTNEGAAVGLFANRNHQSLFLAVCFVLAAALHALTWRDKPARSPVDFAILPIGATLLLLLVFATGSRAGLIAAVLAIVGGCSLRISPTHGSSPVRQKQRRLVLQAGLVSACILLGAAAIAWPRAEALHRLVSEDVLQDARLRLLPTFLGIAQRYHPWGTGFGSFDPVFRVHEPAANLSPIYLNHAHNDLLEIVIEGGLPAAALLAAYLAWIGLRSFKAWRDPRGAITQEIVLQRAGSVISFILLLSSLVDYPLRTPALAAVLAMATAMLASRPLGAIDPKRPVS